ncbi:unnamed protein product [Paramecium sonneborni]|uniref:Uncharacterized protein n=1 Tax=Paramecium sonneborni TaxID=65129 RepID=A0A8S1R7V0_9CILI|nr:unnamed protein product [Paramecium sonneborni]
MGACSSTKNSQNKDNTKNTFNSILANTQEAQKTQQEFFCMQNEQRINLNQTVQRKFKKSGTLSYFEYNLDKIQTEGQSKNNKKMAQGTPQLKIKVIEGIASKEYSVYKGMVKIDNNSMNRIMQHNNLGKLVIMQQLPYDQEGKDYIDWLQKTNLERFTKYLFRERISKQQVNIVQEVHYQRLLNHKLSEQVVCNILDQMFEIINFLHQNNLTHNQLTIDSFSFYYDLQNYLIKLTDLKSIFKPSREVQLEVIKYACPESFRSNHPNKSNDIWSLGIIAYQIITRNLIYEGDSTLSTVQEVKQAILKWTTNQDITNEISEEFQNLIFKMLHPDKSQRITVEECKKHKFIQIHKTHNLNCFFKHNFIYSLSDNLLKWFMTYLINNYENSHYQVGNRIFDILDQDKDGKLNVQELGDFLRRLKQSQGQQRNIKIIQNLIDNQIEIGLQDFILMISNKSIYITHHNLDHSFKKLSNKNQEITVKSLQKVLNISEEELIIEFMKHELYYENYCIPLLQKQYETIMNQLVVVQNEN